MEHLPSSCLLPVVLAGLLTGLAGPSLAQTSEAPPAYVFSHLAGPLGGYGNADGVGAVARFFNPTGLAVDSVGNVYLADSWNTSVRKITPSGSVSTVLTAKMIRDSRLLSPGTPAGVHGLAIDALDNLYVTVPIADVILKMTPTGTLSLYTGQTGLNIYDSTDGPLAQASFFYPLGLAFDPAGNLYVADSQNHIIRKITPQGVVSTFAGMPPQYNHPQGTGVSGRKAFPGSADGGLGVGQFSGPTAVAADAGGNVYVADTSNHTIRKVTPAGEISTLAGIAWTAGSADGQGSAARFHRPNGIAVDTAGNVYVADSGNGVVRKITPAGLVSTLAGVAGDFATVDGTGSAARFVAPKTVMVDRSGRLLVGDGHGEYGILDQAGTYGILDRAGTLRQVNIDGVVTTFAGRGGAHGSADGKGESARFRRPSDVAVDAAGNVFVADAYNHAIRKITPDGTTTTFAGRPGSAGRADGPGNIATFSRPSGIAFDGNSQLIVADHDNHLIRKIAPDGSVTTLAGQPGIAGSADGPAANATFHSPASVAVDAAGNIYVGDGDYFPSGGDPASQFATIRKITPTGEVSTLAGDPRIVPYEQTRSNFDGTGAGAVFGNVGGITVDPAGNLFVTDYIYGRIRKVTSQGVVTSLDLTDATGAAIAPPRHFIGITRDQSGNLFVAEATNPAYPMLPANALIQRITPAGVLTSVAGTSGVYGSVDGTGPAAQFNGPRGLKIDAQGALYVADTENNAIRKGVLAGPPVITTQPQSVTVAAGGNVQLSVTATGVPEPTYQWHFNGVPFQGATSSSLSFANARTSDAGDYTVVVTNAVGNVTSAKATLTVTAAPVPPPPASPGGGGGGGGAPSLWFLGVLAALGVSRRLVIRSSGRC